MTQPDLKNSSPWYTCDERHFHFWCSDFADVATIATTTDTSRILITHPVTILLVVATSAKSERQKKKWRSEKCLYLLLKVWHVAVS